MSARTVPRGGRWATGVPTATVSPRIGVAWSPSPKWVFRAGYGVFFDRYVLANLTRAIEKNGSQAFEQVVDGTAAASLFAGAQAGHLLRLFLGLRHQSSDLIHAWQLPTANKPAPVSNTCSRRTLRCAPTICLFMEL